MTRAQELVKNIAEYERQLQYERSALEALQRSCAHQWGATKYTPEIREAYTVPGDPPGTMGVDWRGPVDVPREEKPMWTRQCALCLKTETTSQTSERVTKTPRFP